MIAIVRLSRSHAALSDAMQCRPCPCPCLSQPSHPYLALHALVQVTPQQRARGSGEGTQQEEDNNDDEVGLRVM
jgi:hypothetical protein